MIFFCNRNKTNRSVSETKRSSVWHILWLQGKEIALLGSPSFLPSLPLPPSFPFFISSCLPSFLILFLLSLLEEMFRWVKSPKSVDQQLLGYLAPASVHMCPPACEKWKEIAKKITWLSIERLYVPRELWHVPNCSNAFETSGNFEWVFFSPKSYQTRKEVQFLPNAILSRLSKQPFNATFLHPFHDSETIFPCSTCPLISLTSLFPCLHLHVFFFN